MWLPLVLSFLSSASAEPATVSIEIIDPTGTSHALTGSLPLEGSKLLELGKGSHRFDVRATQSGEEITVIGELHELRGKKDKLVRIATLTLPAEGTNRAERLSWGAPRGATVPDGLNPNLLAWRIVAQWDTSAAAGPEPEPESAEEADAGEPAESREAAGE